MIREARRAGMYPARRATAARSMKMAAKVAGSVGAVPKRSEAINEETASEAIAPTTMPRAAMRRV